MKITETMNLILSEHNISEAIDIQKTKKNSCSDDGDGYTNWKNNIIVIG